MGCEEAPDLSTWKDRLNHPFLCVVVRPQLRAIESEDKMSFPFKYVREYYGVPACVGRRVVAYGKPGIIVADRGNYIGVTLDSEKPGTVSNYHPVDGIEYGEMGKVRPMTRSQARYLRYIEYGDCFDSFLDFCRWDASPDAQRDF